MRKRELSALWMLGMVAGGCSTCELSRESPVRVTTLPAFPSFPDLPEATTELDETMIVEADFDGGGRRYRATGDLAARTKPGTSVPMFRIVGDGVRFSDVHIEGSGGIRVEGDGVTLENVWGDEVCGAWLTVEGAAARVRASGARNQTRYALGGGIEAGGSTDLLVEDCQFVRVSRPYQFGAGHTGVFRGNWVRYADVVAEGHGDGVLESTGNVFFEVERYTEAACEGARIEARGNRLAHRRLFRDRRREDLGRWYPQ